jgi:hypothetical protein
MKDIQIKCNTKGYVDIDSISIANGISIVLVNEKHIPIAKYHFDSANIENIERLCYTANNYKVVFSISPNMLYEHFPSINN